MDKITLHGKRFRIYATAAQIEEAVCNVAKKLNEDLKNIDTPVFLGVLNGSFMFAADLMRKIEVKSDMVFIKVASYEGTKSTGEIKQLIGFKDNVENRTVIIIEDIIETGDTIEEMVKILKERGAADIRICTLLLKPDIYKKNIKIGYCAMQIPNDFVVGYGLDYNGLGRQYKDLYVLDEE